MKKLLLLLFSMLISFNSYGAGDEPTRYVYEEFNIDNASKYTISTGSMHEFSCLLTQIFFSQEALTAAKNKKKFDFMNSDFTPTSIDLYKNKVYWVDIDLNTKIKNNFVKFENMGLSDEDPLFELILKDNELIFRMETPHEGSTLVCDFPFKELTVEDSKEGKLYYEELDEDGYPIQSICLDTDEWELKEDSGIHLPNRIQPFTGKNLCKYENGQIYESSLIKDGNFNGEAKFWYENGQIWSEGNYKDYQQGKWTNWHENGQIENIQNFKDGKLYGNVTTWNKNGQIESDGNYMDGKKDGKWTEFEENGQIWSEGQYKESKKDGKWISWYENGQKKSEENYKYDMKDGKWISWYENGQKKSEENYKEGVLDGKSRSWTENGQKQLDANYKDGKYDGKYTYWFADDWIVEKLYKDGECISGC
jgi:antitoxin component YwqK of YwqJK toxin-antitoxin module